uniref:Secreted protein n=1 Tax=Anguilla anguilla TaxID=7936 RepID=A0A0E9SJT1_ANGAN
MSPFSFTLSSAFLMQHMGVLGFTLVKCCRFNTNGCITQFLCPNTLPNIQEFRSAGSSCTVIPNSSHHTQVRSILLLKCGTKTPNSRGTTAKILQKFCFLCLGQDNTDR